MIWIIIHTQRTRAARPLWIPFRISFMSAVLLVVGTAIFFLEFAQHIFNIPPPITQQHHPLFAQICIEVRSSSCLLFGGFSRWRFLVTVTVIKICSIGIVYHATPSHLPVHWKGAETEKARIPCVFTQPHGCGLWFNVLGVGVCHQKGSLQSMRPRQIF